ncbi:MAG TPA: 2-oxoacid:acceptor oxidoreductase subunit alpha, partial [Anaerolineae bacterium]|nr:2-oxoacid:acceptor oxidoreductase subunit alpha [Anaerolineae bacterium]
LLKPGGVLIYDIGEFQEHRRQPFAPPEAEGETHIPLPLTRISRELGFSGKGKNAIGLGALTRLFGIPYDKAVEVAWQRWGKGRNPELMEGNLKAIERGYQYVAENFGHVDLTLALPDQGELETDQRLVLTGNQALGLGALAAGCQFFAGYPITPASDIMEFLAAHLPKVGGTMVQAEDEIAAAGMILGAGFAGVRAMTATSGPGLALMGEMLGHASMTEIPVVFVNVQRAGPSTGMPTKTTQSDLNFVMRLGNGEAPRIVLAPTSVEDCFYQMINAFNMAERYQLPVIVLSDQSLATRIETINPFPRLDEIRIVERVTPPVSRVQQNGRDEKEYRRYEITESGISPMAIPGMRGFFYTAEGLEHNERGNPNYDPDMHIRMTEKRYRKLQTAEVEMRQWQFPVFSRFGAEQAHMGVITWGATEGPAREAVARLLNKGLAVAAFVPKVLNPLPTQDLQDFIDRVEVVVVPEV